MSSFCPFRWNLSSQLLVAPKLTAFMHPILGDIKICFVPILNSLDIWSWNVNPRESVKNRLKNTLLGLIDINPSINEFIGYAIEFESICNRKVLEKAHVKIKEKTAILRLFSFIHLFIRDTCFLYKAGISRPRKIEQVCFVIIVVPTMITKHYIIEFSRLCNALLYS